MRWPKDKQREAVALLRLFSTVEVAEMFGVYRGTVAKWAKAHGAPQPPSGAQRTKVRQSREELEELYQRWGSWRAVSDVLGLPNCTVWRTKERLGARP